ncbi:MAG: hypothetical protein OXL34_05285 [Gemmatimonadota bacterium]|nr:hypothetical protein [Gemmatimonadota bacterium]
MLTAYIFCLAVGGGFLALSFFGDFLEGDVDIDADVDVDADMDALAHGSGIAQLFSLRAAINALFGFGAAGSLLHLVWGGGQPILTAAIAGGTGLASGALISTVFGYLKRTESGALRGEQSFVGLTGEVSLEIAPGSRGSVTVRRGDRRVRIRAQMADTYRAAEALTAGHPVVVVEMKDGIASVTPVGPKLLEE